MIYAIQDQGSREYQEDMFDIELINGYLYIGLFDGHNGDYVSKFLKENLKKEIKQRLNNTNIIDINDNKTIPKIIYDSLEKIQNSLNNEKFHVGSTALIVLKNKNRIYIANTGDSRGIVSNHNEKILQLFVEGFFLFGRIFFIRCRIFFIRIFSFDNDRATTFSDTLQSTWNLKRRLTLE